MANEHTVKAFDEELDQLRSLINRMGGLAEEQLVQAVKALAGRDSPLAEHVIEGDARIDRLEREVEDLAVRIIARRQPMALDLRDTIGALKIAPMIERIGDYGKNIAKRTMALNRIPPVKPLFTIPQMAERAGGMVRDVLDAYNDHDVAKARAVWERDAELDDMYDGLFRELLTYMMEDAHYITPCTHLLFVARNIERIGDIATNIAEIVHYQVEGEVIPDERPKHDQSSTTIVDPK